VSSEYVINTGASTFEQDVLRASNRGPVLVDFWASWCAPCRSIAPVLEELAAAFGGALIVAKVDTDAEQELAAQYAIRSLPTMMLFRDGKPVEQIIGAQPGTVIRAAVEKHLPRPGDPLVAAATALIRADELDAAAAKLREALALDPQNYAIHPLLTRILVRQGDFAGAERLIDALPVNISTDAAFDDVRAAIKLASQLPAESERADILERVQKGDVESAYQLAVIEALDGDFDAALERLFELLASHRGWSDGAIHKTILDIFKVMGGDDPRLKNYRTRLARTLN